MSKTRSFTDWRTLVDLFMERGMNLEDAIREAGVPAHLIENVRSYFAEPLKITSPDLIVGTARRDIRRCVDLGNDHPQTFLSDFANFLLNERKWSRSVVESLEKTSLDLVCRFPHPDVAEDFQTRGLVVGYIQSGKTANMAALIARAADQGYKLFIILAGMHDDLRSQTQRRLDQEITGLSDNPLDGPFIAHAPEAPGWARLTISGMSGDFQTGTNSDLGYHNLKLVVLKKNARVLEKFTRFLEQAQADRRQLPALVIDDEADQASIDTNYGKVDAQGDELDPSKVNSRVRELLKILPKCVYVAYTATPFANVLIDEEVEQDLYPRDFIATLPEPPGYQGPRQLFGLGMTASELSPEVEEIPEMDVIRYVPDHDVDLLVTPGSECPPFLSEALLVFVLSSCARLSRGQTVGHFSMLVHPSHKIADQNECAAKIRQELANFKRYVESQKTFTDFVERARALWEQFTLVTASQEETKGSVKDFETVWAFAKSVVESIEVKVLNSGPENVNDLLEYSSPRPRRYVVIGGNRLSRGLTLEGLSVSVFGRDTVYYDTLLQMGRWFGFRDGYKDLTRIYTTTALADRFKDLARIELELRRDFSKYARQPNPPTPEELKPIIRAHPDMVVTARNKQGAGRKVVTSFQGEKSQTVVFPLKDIKALRTNIEVAKGLVAGLGKPSSKSKEGIHVWKDVDSARIIDFLGNYNFSNQAPKVNRQNLQYYISKQNEMGELGLWDVVIPRGNRDREPFSWREDVFSRKMVRTRYTATSIKILSSEGDVDGWREITGRVGDDPRRGVLFLYLIDKNSGVGPQKALFPDPSRAEDVLGLVFLFPNSTSNVTVEYISQAGLGY